MVDLVSVTANIQNNKVEIDTKCIAHSSEERKKLDGPWWVIGAAAFLFQIMDELCVALVQRTHNTPSNSGRWALIPAGVADYACELHNPSFVVKRETNEELKIIKNGICVSPLEVSDLLSINKIKIYDKYTKKTYHDIGDIYVSGKKAYFLRLYKIHETLSDFKLFDGEDLNGNPLDRIIALVPIDKLIGIVCPVKMYQGKKEIAVRDIGLSSFETPTLEWFRDIAVNL